MKNFKSHFIFTRSEQNGIFLLVLIVVVLQLVYFFVDFTPSEKRYEKQEKELTEFQKIIDSIKDSEKENVGAEIFPFNPNFITDYKGYTLGMTPEEIDKLHIFRAEEKWVNSAEDFQKITGISDSLFNEISPYFKFPDWVNSEKPSYLKRAPVTSKTQPKNRKDLNLATLEDLTGIYGIGEVLAGRIINYRNKIGGFLDDIQLKDIYGLNFEVRSELQSQFTVLTIPSHTVHDINEATVLELAAVPYIGYELAREIINYRLLNEKIDNFEELAKIKDFPSEKIDRIALYLSVK
ncbi:ComEA family DNA-binding protein [Gillisia limnaea]|uniref:Helix-hairpin-helix DNA-binding class 1 n=1 Tax=Gillisia limnaea (strain DSM 15749 / LMG 21470 / R-8282) TaxID=865937 RepID=H2BUL4_GILLR|nr:helix-hairpin-helix domain-containing protein [Gillisia limnaea]EHQ01669.1 Helix-hairpin-helix DNA-binding class 1 [Gillisia limnaea DSM 15749]